MPAKKKPNASAPEYHNIIQRIYDRIVETQMPAIRKAAERIADLMAKDGILYVLGSGHSLGVAMELHGRAGGLVPVDIILDRTFARAERLSGYAQVLLDDYQVPKGSVIVIISNSGRNALGIEMALEAKKRGIAIVAVTSLAHSRATASRHPSGKRLFEIADIVIDNCGEVGDAAVALPGIREKIAPTSGVAGMFIMNLLTVEIVRTLKRRGVEPPVLVSANLDRGDEHNLKLRNKYRGRIRGL